MSINKICLLILLFSLTGCIYNEVPPPVITGTYPDTPIIKLPQPSPPVVRTETKYPANWYPPKSIERKWTAIVIHHSGTSTGNAEIFDRWHREGNHWEGVGYDFVIGNGTDSPDGKVEVTFRWTEQKTGAHCGGTPGNWANREGVGICLVGDFNKTSPTRAQIQSLVKLIKFLKDRYQIPVSRIYGHGQVPGANTQCPGRSFPMPWVKSLVR